MTTPRRLRVLHVISAVGPTNGQLNEHCLPLVGAREISICSVYPASIPTPPQITLFEGDGTLRGFLRALRTALAARDYDVVHAHAAVAGMGLVAANVAGRRSMSNCVYTVQNSYRNYRLRNRLLLYALFAAFPRIVFCSNAVEASMPTSLRRLGRGRTAVVPNAVDTRRAERASAGRPRREGFTVVCVGRLIPIKNAATVIGAFDDARDEDSRLVFVGDGELRPELRAEADRRSMNGQVVFTGLVDRDDVYRHVAEGDVVVSASRGEGLPVAILEAMACGRPVILSDIPPHREIVEREGEIALIPPDDVQGFAEALRRYRDMPAVERERLGARCRRIVEERFGLEAMHRAYVPIYTYVMGRRTDRAAVDVATGLGDLR